jgi:hypothetical protein
VKHSSLQNWLNVLETAQGKAIKDTEKSLSIEMVLNVPENMLVMMV